MTISKFVDMFVSGVASGEGHPYKRWQSCNVYVDGRTIYSYGSHFPMAYIVKPNLVWLNGDTFSVSTARHQRELRSALARKSDVTVVIVPNSALGAAGVDYRTIEPIDVKPERWEYTEHTAMLPPNGMVTELTEYVPERTDSSRYYRCDVPEDCDVCSKGRHATYHDTERVTVYPAHDAHLHMHYATVDSWIYKDFWTDVVGYVVAENGKQAVRRDPITGEYSWHTARHWLGDAVFTGESVTRPAHRRDANGNRIWGREITERNYYISSFDRQERRPLYFLSQLPHAVDTLDAAIESLAPDSVKTARELGRHVVRQGDMFAIPMEVTTRQLKAMGATLQKRKATIELNRSARESVAQRDAVNALLTTMPPYPTRQYFQCGQHSRDDFDLIYKDWQAACDAWGDALVARYVAAYPDLEPITRWSWQSASKFKPSAWHMTRNSDATALYGTAHTASEVATLPDGRQFARGIMYHDPAVIGQTRAADHRRQKLGKQWHLVARNTVPVAGTGTGRRAA